jgi:AmmeMemoRadiSam system protein B
MSKRLPRLRTNLDFMPSPVPDRPGLLIRDAYRYSDATLIIPAELVESLRCFDGETTDLELRAELVRITGDLQVGELEANIIDTLASSGFLEDETYARMREERHREFAGQTRREPSHIGSAYPEEPGQAREQLGEWMNGAGPKAGAASSDSLIGIAAPHVSPEGGWHSYQAAYGALRPEYKDRTFVILGTSHYGEAERFGLTRKAFVTPFGESAVDQRLVDTLVTGAPDAILMEDYCHAIEHSIEFQVLFLQYIYGPEIRILPILCGSFAHSIYRGGAPEADERVRRFLGTLGDMAAKEGDRLLWVLGIDMAHMGRRYGDNFAAIAGRGEMSEVAERDRGRIDRINAGDGKGFWDLVQQRQDDLKWCGSSPLYTFLHTVPDARGALNHYEQWNIDEQSVVSFAGISFSKGA